MRKTYPYLVSFFMLVSILLSLGAKGQDIQFSQFYSIDLYQNPAFTGSHHNTRAMLHQRVQWPSLQAKYVTSWAAVDTYFKQYKMGAGLSVMRDIQGADEISSNDVGLYYSYELHLNSQWVLRSGLQANIVFRDFDYASLSFPSQYDDQGLNSDNPATDLSGFGRTKVYADFSTGFLLYSNSLWVGFAAHHLNQPKQTDVEGIEPLGLPVKFSLTGGYKIVLNNSRYSSTNENPLEEISLSPTFHYKSQGRADQFDAGLYSNIKHFVVGLWYRGIPFKEYEFGDFRNSESMVFIAGYKAFNWGLTYSYDHTISSLNRVSTGGSHEINLHYTFGKIRKNAKPTKRRPCPHYM